MRPLVSICIPVFNEEDNIPLVYKKIKDLSSEQRKNFKVELIFTDNASVDGSWKIICSLCKKDKMVKGYRFGRNIGYQKSILYNFRFASGDVVVQLDADLQDPPELIPQMVQAWQNGSRVVSGSRLHRAEGFFQNFFRSLGYRFLFKASGGVLRPDIGDFRLLDRSVVNNLVKTKNPAPYLRGMISEMGFPELILNYRRQARLHGVSKFPILKVISLGWNGFLTFSKWPLNIVSGFVFLSSLFSLGSIGISLGLYFSARSMSLFQIFLIIFLSISLLFFAFCFAVLLFYVRSIYESTVSKMEVDVTFHTGEKVALSK